MKVNLNAINYSSHGEYDICQKMVERSELVNVAQSFSELKCILRKSHCNSGVSQDLLVSFSYCSDKMLDKRDSRKETFVLAQALRVQFIKAAMSWLQEHEAAGHMTGGGDGAWLSFSSLSSSMKSKWGWGGRTCPDQEAGPNPRNLVLRLAEGSLPP